MDTSSGSTPSPQKKIPRVSKKVSSNWDVAGKIFKIQLINFMCHKNLTVTLHDGINFISGANGSGKSAIMTGVVLGLGGRASATNRGTNLKELITKGKHHFEVIILLCNEGPLSFKAEIYGSMIKIRRIVRETSSGYEISDEKGKIITKSKDELDNILYHFSISVNNPVAILNQDTARNFLRTKNNSDLYTLFMLSSGLKELIDKHENLGAAIQKIWSICSEQQQTMLHNFRDVDEFKKKLEKIKELQTLKENKTALLLEEAWAKVLDLQTELKNLKRELLTLEAQEIKTDEVLKKKEGSVAILEERGRELEAVNVEINDERYEIRNKLRQTEISDRENGQKIKHLENGIAKLRDAIRTEGESMKTLQDRLDNLDVQNATAAEEREKVAKKKAEVEEKIKGLNSVKSTNEIHRRNLQEDYNKKVNTVLMCENAAREVRNRKAAAYNTVQNLKSEDGHLHIYSNRMPLFVREIDKAFRRGEFKNKPIGPIGHYLKLKHEMFGPAIEGFLGGSFLHSFCVDSNQDAAKLERIAQRCDLKPCPSIVISKFLDKSYNVRKISHPEFQTLLDALIIEPVPVLNALVDCKRAESILLIPTGDQASQIMPFEDRIPKYCTLALTRNGDLFFPAPRYRCSSRKVRKQSYFLQTDKNIQLRTAEEDYKLVVEEEKKKSAELENSVNASCASQRNLKKTENEIFRVNTELQRLSDLLFNLDMREIPPDQNREIIMEDINYRQVKLEETKANLQKMIEELQQCQNLEQEYTKTKKQLNESVTQGNARAITHRTELDKIQAELKHLTDTFTKSLADMEIIHNKVEETKKIIYATDNELALEMSSAREMGETPRALREVPVIQRNILKVNSKIQALSEVIGEEDVECSLDTFKERAKMYKQQMTIYDTALKSIMSIMKRYPILGIKLEKLKDRLSASLKEKFKEVLKCRNYKGELKFDHNMSTLDLVVHTNTESTSANTKSLSGGERSFSMASFILSLWDEMRSPFFFLDEFDVFMDNLNREAMINLIMSYGRSHPERQFVLMTPNSFQMGHESFAVTFRMPDPRKDD